MYLLLYDESFQIVYNYNEQLLVFWEIKFTG